MRIESNLISELSRASYYNNWKKIKQKSLCCMVWSRSNIWKKENDLKIRKIMENISYERRTCKSVDNKNILCIYICIIWWIDFPFGKRSFIINNTTKAVINILSFNFYFFFIFFSKSFQSSSLDHFQLQIIKIIFWNG